jgi:hypothetical protein
MTKPLIPAPDYMLPNPRSLGDIANAAHSLTPRLPPAGQIAVWVWFEPGDVAMEPVLGKLIDLQRKHGVRTSFQFWCVIRPRRLSATLNYESVINDRIEAFPDIGGEIAAKYAGGQVPAIVAATASERRLVTIDQLEALLEPRA